MGCAASSTAIETQPADEARWSPRANLVSAQPVRGTQLVVRAGSISDQVIEDRSAEAWLVRSGDWARFGGQTIEPLLECTTLVCVRWLLRLARSGGLLPAWQQLPEEAKVSADDLRCSVGLVRGGAYDVYYGLPLLALSYPWFAPHHPDPSGVQLRMLVPIFEAIVANLDKASTHRSLTWGVLWDFCALPQRGYSATGAAAAARPVEDRSPAELARFKSGLRSINEWYMHPYVWTLLVDVPLDATAVNQQPFGGRGWTTFERAVASLVKNMANLLSLARFDKSTMTDWISIIEGCRAGRPAPMSPTAFAAHLRAGVASGEVKFTNAVDMESVVLPNYERGFAAAYSNRLLGEIWYADQFTTDAHAAALAETLVAAHAYGGLRQVQMLRLDSNRLSDEGLAHLLRAFCTPGALPRLSTLVLFDNAIGDNGVRALAELIEGGALPALVRCGVDGNPAGEEATRTLKRALRARERAAQDGALEAPTAHRLAPGTGTAAVARDIESQHERSQGED